MSRDGLRPQAQQAVGELVRLVEEGFTGSLVVEFKDGVPQLARTTRVQRFKGAKRAPLDRPVAK